MTKITGRQGSREVKTISNCAEGPFWSRLYVNGGETATLVTATHKTMRGAEAWARKAVSR